MKSGLSGNQVALWETSSDHPGGEVFIAGAREVEVAETPKVQALLASGQLVRVDEPKPAAKTSKKAKGS
ncbi:MAG: hypothetical protein KDE59_14690 [Anaerolineales bacterium]|nr:hypothetical protein [Anaerolineales bacterium]